MKKLPGGGLGRLSRLDEYDPAQAGLMKQLGIIPQRELVREVLKPDDALPTPAVDKIVRPDYLNTIAYPDMDPRTSHLFPQEIAHAPLEEKGGIGDTVVDVNPPVIDARADENHQEVLNDSIDIDRLFVRVHARIIDRCTTQLGDNLASIKAQTEKDFLKENIDFKGEVDRILPNLRDLFKILIEQSSVSTREVLIANFIQATTDLVGYLLFVEYWNERNKKIPKDPGWPSWVFNPVRRELVDIRKSTVFGQLNALEGEAGRSFTNWRDQFLYFTLTRLTDGLNSLEKSFVEICKMYESDFDQTNLPIAPATINAFIATILGAQQLGERPGEKGIADEELARAEKYRRRILGR